jgi:hypothetical protein
MFLRPQRAGAHCELQQKLARGGTGLQSDFAEQQFNEPKCRNGSKTSFPTRSRDVRFTPESDRLLRRKEMTLCAISDQSAVQQNSASLDHLVGDVQ